MSNYSYREFVRYYQDINKNLEILIKQAENEKFYHAEVKPETKKELGRHSLMINILSELAEKNYNKSHDELLNEKN